MKKLGMILGIVLGVFVLLHFLLEPIVENVVNKKLDQLEGYRGSIEDVDIQLFRGAYRIKGIDIREVSKQDSLRPFVHVDTLDLSVQWGALFDGKIVGEVLVSHPVINYLAQPSEKDTIESDTAEVNNWTAKLQELIPLTINRFEVRQGSITYKDPAFDLGIDTYIRNLNVLVQNISNVADSTQELPTSLSANALSLGEGTFNVDMKLNLLRDKPAFDASIKIDTVDLTALNDVLEAYANVDLEKGVFSMISEINVDKAQVDGYIKPFFENLEVFDFEQDVKQEEEKGFFGKVWEALVGLGSEVIENQPKERVASRVPIEGNLENTDPDVSVAVWNIFKNAFVEVIEKEFESLAQAGDASAATN